MSDQETVRQSLKGIESAKSQITGKFKSEQEEDENVKGIDAVNDFLSRIGANDETSSEAESETEEVRDIRDIFASLTSDDVVAETEEDILKPEMSYQEIPAAESEEEKPVDIYADESDGKTAEAVSVSEENENEDEDEFLKKFKPETAVPVRAPRTARAVSDKDPGGEFIIVEENNGNLLIIFEKGGKNAVSLKMPALSIPDGYPVNAMLAPDINLSLTYSRKGDGKDILNVVLEHKDNSVCTEVIPGKPFIRRIAFGGMEFELFAGAEVTAGLFSIFVEERRIVYKY